MFNLHIAYCFISLRFYFYFQIENSKGERLIHQKVLGRLHPDRQVHQKIITTTYHCNKIQMAVHHPYKKVVQRHHRIHRQHQHQICCPIHPKNWVIYQICFRFIKIHWCQKYFLSILQFCRQIEKVPRRTLSIWTGHK